MSYDRRESIQVSHAGHGNFAGSLEFLRACNRWLDSRGLRERELAESEKRRQHRRENRENSRKS